MRRRVLPNAKDTWGIGNKNTMIFIKFEYIVRPGQPGRDSFLPAAKHAGPQVKGLWLSPAFTCEIEAVRGQKDMATYVIEATDLRFSFISRLRFSFPSSLVLQWPNFILHITQ